MFAKSNLAQRPGGRLYDFLSNYPGSTWPKVTEAATKQGNWLYLVWTPNSKFIYMGSTVDPVRRVEEHNEYMRKPKERHRLPAYGVIASKQWVFS